MHKTRELDGTGKACGCEHRDGQWIAWCERHRLEYQTRHSEALETYRRNHYVPKQNSS